MLAASMPMKDIPPQSAPKAYAAPGTSWLKIFVMAIGIAEGHTAAFHLIAMLVSLTDDTAPSLGWLATSVIVTSPFVTAATLYLATKNRLQHAIMGIGTLGLLDWLNYLPSFTKHGPDIGTLGSLFSMFFVFVLPAVCIAGIALAARNRLLWVAAILAAMQMILLIVGTGIFAAAVALYGF